MTLVVTTASAHGITVVGDRAVTVIDAQGNETYQVARKIFYSKKANLSLAMWGDYTLQGSSSTMETWMPEFVGRIVEHDTIESVGLRLAQELTANLYTSPIDWKKFRRGVHIAGYVGGVPHVYHVHTGDPTKRHYEPTLHYDIPSELPASVPDYLAHLKKGGRAYLFNGFPELYGLLLDSLRVLRDDLERDVRMTIPAPSINGQLALDRALVRFAANLMAAAGRPPSVSEDVDCIAFDASGLVTTECKPLTTSTSTVSVTRHTRRIALDER